MASRSLYSTPTSSRLCCSHGTNPSILVLNFCGSLTLHGDAQRVAAAVVCWPNRVNDKQCREFASLLYRGLACEFSIGANMDRAQITLPRHGGLALPQLAGDGSAQLQ